MAKVYFPKDYLSSVFIPFISFVRETSYLKAYIKISLIQNNNINFIFLQFSMSFIVYSMFSFRHPKFILDDDADGTQVGWNQNLTRLGSSVSNFNKT